MTGAKMIRVDKNGTKYYESHKCPKCGGTGYIEAYYYVDGGRCFLCAGTGRYTHTWKEYTPEYSEKLEQRRIARKKKQAYDKNAKMFHRWHLSEDGSAYVVLGHTYERKDMLKGMGAYYNPYMGWYFDKPVKGVDTQKLTIDEFAEYQDMYGQWHLPDYDNPVLCYKVREIQDAYAAKDNPSQWIGKVGDKLSVDVTVKYVAGFNTNWGYTNIFTFVDEYGNEIVWKTDTRTFHKGETMKLTGKIKEHSEFRAVKQTVLTRCKIASWSCE